MTSSELTTCPCDAFSLEFEPWIAAGLDSLPRQTRTFSRVRRALLVGVRSADKTALSRWEARGTRDLGILWLEMWAYVADVLDFYDERIANETYIRTAQRRTSLRRLIELLGYIQAPGVAGSVVLGALADGRVPVVLPAGTAFRSDAFGEEAPQIFELDEPVRIEPAKNEWRVGPLKNGTLPQATPTVAADPQAGLTSPRGRTKFLPFEPGSLGVGADSYISIGFSSGIPMVDRIVGVKPFEGADSRSYLEVELNRGIQLAQTAPERLSVKTPTSTAGVSAISSDRMRLSLDGLYPRIKQGDYVLITNSQSASSLSLVQVSAVATTTRVIEDSQNPQASPRILAKTPVTQLILLSMIGGAPSSLSVHFDWVRAGTLAAVRSIDIAPSELSGLRRVPLDGVLEVPSTGRQIEGEFLIQGSNERGTHGSGSVQIDGARRGAFGLQSTASSTGPSNFLAPLQIFGNVIHASRGESVHREILGSGNPRDAHQRFTLRKKPLTYLPAPELERGIRSTLEVRVDGILWTEVRSFYGSGSEDTVYTVRHDDAQETILVFGDGVRGARLPSGVDNVVASYRFGSGAKAPPAGAVTQIARSVLGLRGVRSPVAGRPGRDPDSPEILRTTAPRSLLLLGRAVSVADFEALTSQVLGVVRASAEFAWLPEEQASGVSVRYVGGVSESEVLARLRSMAEPTLHIEVRRAQPLLRRLSLSILVAPRRDVEQVRRAVQEELRKAYGVLSIEVAPIGGQLWVSRIFEAVQRVPGVVAVSGGSVRGEGFVQDLSLSDVLCVPRGHYFDFLGEGGVEVTTVEASEVEARVLRQGGVG